MKSVYGLSRSGFCAVEVVSRGMAQVEGATGSRHGF